MQLQFDQTEYQRIVQKLRGLEVYKAQIGIRSSYYTTIEEARQAALEWFSFRLSTYKRECPAKRLTVATIKLLSTAPGTQV